MRISRTLKIVLPFGIILVGLASFVILVKTRPSPPRRPAQIPRPLVEVYQVSDEPVTVKVQGFGTVRAKRKISLVPQVSGEVVFKSAQFEPGAYFSEGEVLLRIDETDYRLAVERAAAEVARAEYNLVLAEEEADVARREWEQIQSGGPAGMSGISEAPTALVFREPQLKLAQAELEAARAALDQARVDLSRCVVKPGFDGRVLSVDVDQGQYIRAGNPLSVIHATDIAEVTVAVPDADLAWIEMGASVDISAEFAGSVHHWPGSAMRIGGAVDEQSRLVPVVVEIPDPYHAQDGRPPLVEGMFVEVSIQGRHLPGAIAIPRSALRSGDIVWVLDAQDRLEIRPVSVARAGVDRAIVTSGLTDGERVCISNLQVVSDGMLVRVASPGATVTAERGGQ